MTSLSGARVIIRKFMSFSADYHDIAVTADSGKESKWHAINLT